MWGRAGQILSTVLAVVLLFPASPLLPKHTFGPYFVDGRAFPTVSEAEPEQVEAQLRPRSAHTYYRLASSRFVPPADRTALIVGINHARGTPPLPGSVRDARHMYAALIGYGFRPENIELLIEEQATRPAILQALRSLAERSPATGITVFAIATHTRRVGSTNHLATAEGARISASELAKRLGKVRARTWIALPTCYAGGYALPGIVGNNRIVTFASSADRQSYQLGEAGSFLFIHMVRRAMLEARAPYSVESAFEFARAEIEHHYPEQVPEISDGIPEDLVLGPSPRVMTERHELPAEDTDPEGHPYQYSTSRSSGEYGSEPSPTTAPRRRRGPAAVCGNVTYNCPR